MIIIMIVTDDNILQKMKELVRKSVKQFQRLWHCEYVSSILEQHNYLKSKNCEGNYMIYFWAIVLSNKNTNFVRACVQVFLLQYQISGFQYNSNKLQVWSRRCRCRWKPPQFGVLPYCSTLKMKLVLHLKKGTQSKEVHGRNTIYKISYCKSTWYPLKGHTYLNKSLYLPAYS